MKKNIIVSAIAMLYMVNTAKAQLKVTTQTGKVRIGLEQPFPLSQTDDPYNVLSMHVYGPTGDYRAGSKLAFGDFGDYYNQGMNVFIGEYTNDDTDRMWLHGKLGTYFTWGGKADRVYGYYDVDKGNVFHYNCDVYAYSFVLASDARFKTNVAKIGNAMDYLKKLNGVSYNLLPHELDKIMGGSKDRQEETGGKAAGPSTEKSSADKERFAEIEKKMQQPGPKRLGLIAQEVEKVLPELVKTDSTNYKYVDYIGLIPVLIEGVKEQEMSIEAQNDKIKELTDRINTLETRMIGWDAAATGVDDNGKGSATTHYSFLYQNSPNPFTSVTEIGYFLTAGVKEAYINIYNLSGSIVKSKPLGKNTGRGTISVSGSELQAGMYIYNLITDGKEADVKRMVLVK